MNILQSRINENPAVTEDELFQIIGNHLSDNNGLSFPSLDEMLSISTESNSDGQEINLTQTVTDGFFIEDTTTEEAGQVIGDASQSLMAFFAAAPLINESVSKELVNHDSARSISNLVLTKTPVPGLRQTVLSDDNIGLSPTPAGRGVDEKESNSIVAKFDFNNNVSATKLTQAEKRAEATKTVTVMPQFFAKSLVSVETEKLAMAKTETRQVMTTASLAGIKEIIAAQPANFNGDGLLAPRATTTTDLSKEIISLSENDVQLGSKETIKQLHNLLKDRIQLQLDNKTQQATIRLDPPTLGKIDILVNLEAGRLAVQLNSHQPEIQRMLQQLSTDLRQQLVDQNYSQVNVFVSSNHSQQHSQQQQRHYQQSEPPLLDNIQENITQDRKVQTDDSVIVTV